MKNDIFDASHFRELAVALNNRQGSEQRQYLTKRFIPLSSSGLCLWQAG
jgi:hypothetical protein